ncbi:MAG: site-specific DNA-methyltransferase [Clostridia bacterium]|nr:site-specific DNA-methyltransferase [Clostridia bacterium]
MKSERNKTIDISVADGREYLEKCLTVKDKVRFDETDIIINGDTFSVLPHIPDKSVDLLVVDPPYNLTKKFGGMNFKKTDADSYAEYTRKWLEAVLPKLKNTASVYVCCDWQSGMIIGNILADYLIVRNRITWQREKGRGASANWKNGMEDIWFATLTNDYTFNLDAVKIRKKVMAPYKENGKPKDWEETKEGNFRNTCPSNFWDDISIPYWSMPENTTHPTQKPEKLIAKLILASSDEGDTVLDIFSGSGTTPVTAKKLGRKYVGIELDEQYCVFTQKRLEMAEKDASIQGFSDGVFWERNSFHNQRKTKPK